MLSLPCRKQDPVAIDAMLPFKKVDHWFCLPGEHPVASMTPSCLAVQTAAKLAGLTQRQSPAPLMHAKLLLQTASAESVHFSLESILAGRRGAVPLMQSRGRAYATWAAG